MNDTWGLTDAQWAAVAAIGIVATALIALITAVLVLGQLRAARRQLTDARRAQAEQERPYVIVSIDASEAGPQLLDFVVQNVGKTPARNVRIHVNPPPVRADEEPGMELSKARLFNESLSLLPPGRTIRMFFDSTIDRRGRDLPTNYRAQISYENSAGEQWDEEGFLDLDALRGAMFIETYGMHHLAQAVREMNKLLKKASVMGQRGRLETDATVEQRTDRNERVGAEQRRRQQRHKELVAEAQQAQRQRSDDEPPSSERTAPIWCIPFALWGRRQAPGRKHQERRNR